VWNEGAKPLPRRSSLSVLGTASNGFFKALLLKNKFLNSGDRNDFS